MYVKCSRCGVEMVEVFGIPRRHQTCKKCIDEMIANEERKTKNTYDEAEDRWNEMEKEDWENRELFGWMF